MLIDDRDIKPGTRPESPVTLSATQARQGERGASMVTVRLASLGLAVFVWIGAEVYGALVEEESFVNDGAVPATDLPLTANDPTTGTPPSE